MVPQQVMAFDRFPLVINPQSYAGVIQTVKIPTPAISSAGGGICLSFWYKKNVGTSDGFQYLLDCRDATGDANAYLAVGAIGTGWTLWVDGVSTPIANFPFTSSTWKLIVLERAGRSWNAGIITLGSRYTNAEKLGGASFWDFRVYNRIQTAAEKADYLNQPFTGMVRQYQFRADTATVAYDTSGNGANATKNNFTA
ncbi:hypothetical protein GCM10027346_20890 [Hymenobacter seoulensis]